MNRRTPSNIATRIRNFQKTVCSYYASNGRHFPWRDTTDPYAILVSEFMLQQTQVDRVVAKFDEFMKRFTTVEALAHASLATVLRVWQGLGYNRRALYLHRAAQTICSRYSGKVPLDPAELQTLPGIGPYTAGAIAAFAFNQPTVFIETNIRSAVIYQFFPHTKTVSDSDILPILEQALDQDNPREWYWALMDYGAHIKQTVGNPNSSSTTYTKQSRFEGSPRQARGAIIRYLTKVEVTTANDLTLKIGISVDVIRTLIAEMERDGLLVQRGESVRIA